MGEQKGNEVTSKNKKVIEGKKKHVGLVILVVFICIAIIGTGAFFYLKTNNNEMYQKVMSVFGINMENDTSDSEDDNETNDELTNDTKDEDVDDTNESKDDKNIPEGSTLIDMSELKKKNYVELEANKDWCVDLNGDGVYEVLRYENESDGEYFVAKITLNNDSYVTNENFGEEIKSFYIVDIDNTDEELHVAMESWSYNEDTYYSLIYRYSDEGLKQIECIDNSITNIEYNVDNTPGKIGYVTQVNTIMTTHILYFVQFDKESQKFVTVGTPEYEYRHWNGDEHYVELLKDMYIYNECDKSSEKTLIKPQNVYLEKVKFENFSGEGEVYSSEYWVYLSTDDGHKGWIKVEKHKIDGNLEEEYFGELYCG